MPNGSCLAKERENMSRTDESKVYVGVDLHKTQFTVCAMDADEAVCMTGVYRTHEEGYRRFINELHEIEGLGVRIDLAVESTGNARYFKNRMEAEGFAVVVVNTSKFKVITMSTKKTDANDAVTLAYYLMKGMLPEAHLCSQTSEEIRRMMKTRSILVQSTVKIKNQIHGMMLGYGIETKSGQLQSKKKRQELFKDLEDHGYSEFTASSLKVTLDILDGLYEQIKAVEKQLQEMVKGNETVALLQTVPGIGFLGATTIAAYTEDMDRFDGDFKRFASYLGIVPSVHNSNERIHMGRITKHGPEELRTTFVQIALGMVRMPNKTAGWRIIEDYQRKKIEKGTGRAIIALTRKVARIIFAMLLSKAEFNPALMVQEHKKIQQTA